MRSNTPSRSSAVSCSGIPLPRFFLLFGVQHRGAALQVNVVRRGFRSRSDAGKFLGGGRKAVYPPAAYLLFQSRAGSPVFMPKIETRPRLVESKSKFWLLALLLLVAIFNY